MTNWVEVYYAEGKAEQRAESAERKGEQFRMTETWPMGCTMSFS